MFTQQGVNDLPLHSDAASVDDPDFPEAALDGLIQILFHDNLDLTRLKRVQVDGVFDRNLVHSVKYNGPL